MADKVFQLKLYWSTGVCPRGAQVRQRCGRWLTPLSSMKTIVRPSFRAFFNGGPLMLLPPTDRCFVAFAGPPRRSLRAPPERDQQLPDMPPVVADVELAFDQVRDARAGPQRRLIAQRLRPTQQELYQPFSITRAQPRFPPGPLQRGRPAQAILPCQRATVWRTTLTRPATSV